MNALHLIVGEEEFLIDRTIQAITAEIRDTMDEDPQALPISTLRAGDVTTGELVELLSPSLFGEDRLVILHHAEAAGKDAVAAITTAVEQPAPGIVLVVVHSGGGRAKNLVKVLTEAGADVTECPKVTKASEREAFITREFRNLEVRPSADTVHTLLDAVGGDLRELASAVSQLVADTGGQVDASTVRKYYSGVQGVTGFHVADLVLAGKTEEALAAVHWALVGGLHPVPIADAIGDAVLGLSRVASVGQVDPFSSARTLGMPPWKIKKAQQQIRQWSRARLAEAVQLCAQLNGDVKGQAADAQYALEKAVRQISLVARG